METDEVVEVHDEQDITESCARMYPPQRCEPAGGTDRSGFGWNIMPSSDRPEHALSGDASDVEILDTCDRMGLRSPGMVTETPAAQASTQLSGVEQALYETTRKLTEGGGNESTEQ